MQFEVVVLGRTHKQTEHLRACFDQASVRISNCAREECVLFRMHHAVEYPSLPATDSVPIYSSVSVGECRLSSTDWLIHLFLNVADIYASNITQVIHVGKAKPKQDAEVHAHYEGMYETEI